MPRLITIIERMFKAIEYGLDDGGPSLQCSQHCVGYTFSFKSCVEDAPWCAFGLTAEDDGIMSPGPRCPLVKHKSTFNVELDEGLETGGGE